jgi:hypothetical protein
MTQGIKDHESTVSTDSFAKIVAVEISQPDSVGINKVLFRPTSQEY